MVVTKLDIPCIWRGTLTGVLVKSESTNVQPSEVPTTKIIGIHGWLDNLNSLLPLAEELINRHPGKIHTVIEIYSQFHLYF